MSFSCLHGCLKSLIDGPADKQGRLGRRHRAVSFYSIPSPAKAPAAAPPPAPNMTQPPKLARAHSSPSTLQKRSSFSDNLRQAFAGAGSEVNVPAASAARRGVNAGIKMSWLKDFARRVPPGVSTAVVVETIIKPETASACCRYVAVIEEADPGAVGRASAFASHTWCAPFRDLVAALAHVLGDDGFVWIDIFAVLQWPTAEQAADLDFTQVVQATSVLVLVGTHVEAVARLDADDTLARRVPEQARKLCAFFRVWCLVELVAALRADKPVLLLVGSAVEGDALIFEPNAGMLGNLFLVLDVEKAAASVEADRVRILDAVRRGSGFDAVNSIARGAVVGAARCMWQRQVLQAAAGNLPGLKWSRRPSLMTAPLVTPWTV